MIEICNTAKRQQFNYKVQEPVITSRVKKEEHG